MISSKRLLVVVAVLLMVAASAPAAAQPPSADAHKRGVINAALGRMSLEERVGQLFVREVYGASADDTSMASANQRDYGVDTPAEAVAKYQLGGVIYFSWSGNTEHPNQMATLSNGLQEVATSTGAKVPLIVATDQEGGVNQRMLEPATVFPGNMALGATRSTDLNAAQYRIIGDELNAVGVNTNFAPVLDVNTNPVNPVTGVRSYGERPDLVGEFGAIATRQLQDAGVSATLKHFPGGGDRDVDSHTGLPIGTYDRQTLDEFHLAPFKEAIDAGADMVMSVHMILEAVDPEVPATLSPAVLTGILREELGFDGVIITDALNMAAVREHWSDDRVPVLALKAGADMLLMPPDFQLAYEAVLDAVRSGELKQSRINESVRRILEMKYDRGLFHDPFTPGARVGEVVGAPEHLAVAEDIARAATTIVRNDGILPLEAGTGTSTLVVGPSGSAPGTIGSQLGDRGLDVTVQTTSQQPTQTHRAAAVAVAEEVDLVVATTSNAWQNTNQVGLVEDLRATGTPVLVVATQTPYDLGHFPEVNAYVATYGSRTVSLTGAVEVLFDESPPSGRLPVHIPTADGEGVLYPYGHGLEY
jgi:beta-N-acetylhexosaminidase